MTWRLLLAAAVLSLSCAPAPVGSASRALEEGDPTGVKRFDLHVSLKTSATDREMPDPALRDQPAKVWVRRVAPLCGEEICADKKGAVILVHGASVDGASAFDLDYGDYSLME